MAFRLKGMAKEDSDTIQEFSKAERGPRGLYQLFLERQDHRGRGVRSSRIEGRPMLDSAKGCPARSPLR
jgi:hypothetical protein